jgi:GNAT superfamily N-acetyltransferase
LSFPKKGANPFPTEIETASWRYWITHRRHRPHYGGFCAIKQKNAAMPDWLIERLNKSHERSEFCCGQAPLDDFLRHLVNQYEKRKLGRTYVAVRGEEKRVVGYYTLAASSISFEHLPEPLSKKLPKHPVPVILLARLAVDQTVQKQGLGKLLLGDALTRCLNLSTHLGTYAIEVEAIDALARDFYLKYSFIALEDSPMHLFLPIATIKGGSK